MDLNLVIGGEAGQGLKTISGILGKTIFRMNYHLYSSKDYMSRIRGGHNFINLRLGTEELTGPKDKIDLLVVLNEETVARHKQQVDDEGIIITGQEVECEVRSLVLPAEEMAAEVNPKALNTVFMGAVLKALSLDIEVCKEVLAERFTEEQIRDDNIELLKQGYQKGEEVFSLPPADKKGEQIYLDGNKALALGGLAGGVKYYSAYPMSPSTSIMSYFAGKQKEMGVVVEQAEDEIAAINMALGASYGGLRSMTGTSGGGLALMNEGVGLAGITETPLVITDVQRPGPATGLPTRTSQGDLLFAINSSQGEFPIMVTAHRDHENAFYNTFRVLNLADKYQIPVIILSDQFLADSATNIPEFDLEQLTIEHNLVDKNDYQSENDYQRYEITEEGISPRAYPGQLAGTTIVADSDEHDEKGHIVESADQRRAMADKRARKEEALKEVDLKEPLYLGPEGKDIEYLLLGWGSTFGPLQEALDLLQKDGLKVGYLSFTDIWPLPEEKLTHWKDKDVPMINVENNSRGQFSRLIRQETGINIEHNILKHDGRPFSGQEIYARIKEEVIN